MSVGVRNNNAALHSPLQRGASDNNSGLCGAPYSAIEVSIVGWLAQPTDNNTLQKKNSVNAFSIHTN